MLNLIKLKATNVLSYPVLDIEFPQGLCLLEGYNYDENTANGSGKSSIIDIVCYAIYGNTPRNIKTDEIIRWGEGSCEIELLLSKHNYIYKIIRTRGKNELLFYKNDVLLNGKDAKETQQIIIKHIGLSYESFLQTVYFAQGTSLGEQFLFANDEIKKEIFTEIQDLYIYDQCLDAAKTDFKELSKKKEAAEHEITLNETLLQREKESIDEYKLRSHKFEELRDADKNNILKKIELAKEELNKAKKERKQNLKLNEAIVEFQGQIEKLQMESNPSAEKEYNKLNIEKSIKNTEISGKSKERTRIWNLVQQKKCPTCGQDIQTAILSNDIAIIDDEIKNLEKTVADIDIQLPNLAEKVAQEKYRVNEISNINLKIAIARKTLEESGRIYENTEYRINNAIKDYEAEIVQIEKRENNFMDLLQQSSSKITQYDGVLKAKKKILDTINGYFDIYEVLIKAFSREGIKAFVFAQMINELNIFVSDYMQKLFDGNIRIKFDIQSVTSSGKIKQVINTIFTVDGIERSVLSLSGGEKNRVILAVNFALSRLVSSRSTSIGFMFLDECFVGLDNRGKERVMSFLKELQQHKDMIYVIDHQTEFQQAFDSTIKIEKRHGVSCVI